jgi:tetratricopeptide (TPR) repeat protein
MTLSPRLTALLAVLAATTTTAGRAAAQAVEYTSPAGVAYRSLPDTGSIARASKALAADPHNARLILQLGMAQVARQQYREAIETFTRGIAEDPKNVAFYRERGHRYLSLRQLAKAMDDLTHGFALDSTDYGVLYHLGIVRFAGGDFDGAAAAFQRALSRAPNVEELDGSTDWLWMSLSRAGRHAAAELLLQRHPDSLPGANAYAQRLKLYRGQIGPDQVITPADTDGITVATLSFGLGDWYLAKGDTARAKPWFERAVQTTGWPAFGFILSEVELERLK